MGDYAVPDPQVIFQQQYESVRRDEVVGVLLALFLGCFGIHHFYLGRVGLGVLYCVFCWTGIPAILGVIECFFMPGRVRMYNAAQAAGLAVALGIAIPGYVGYPGWVAPGYTQSGYAQSGYDQTGYAQPAQQGYVPVQTAPGIDTTLSACGNCQRVNPAGAKFCTSCGTQLG